jgi:hypothetical protein
VIFGLVVMGMSESVELQHRVQRIMFGVFASVMILLALTLGIIFSSGPDEAPVDPLLLVVSMSVFIISGLLAFMTFVLHLIVRKMSESS